MTSVSEFKFQCHYCLRLFFILLYLANPDIRVGSQVLSGSYNYRQNFFPTQSQSQSLPQQNFQEQFSSQVRFPGSTSGQSQANNYYEVPASAPAASSGGGNTDGIQQMFTEMFDWNRDLGSDRRFQVCSPPDISQISESCPQKDFYFGMNPGHRMAVGMVKDILMGQRSTMESVCIAGAMRDMQGMNPNVWIRGVVAASMTSPELFDLSMPPIVEIVPSMHINSEAMQQVRNQARVSRQSRICVLIDGNVGRDNGIENLLWYWREDVMVNAFHLSWHLTYPFSGTNVRADRRGELFYFTHHSHLARYHAERLSNGLGRVVPLEIDYGRTIPEQYHPHLNDTNSAQSWTPRGLNNVFQDTSSQAIQGVPPNISISSRSQDIQRVQEAIYNRALLTPNGQYIRIDTSTGVDLLGDVIESSTFSVNPNFYGPFGFHNEGHVLISVIEDPRNQLRMPPGVMVEVAVAMRDPAFYTYHTPVDDLFDYHKQTLAPYAPTGGEYPLIWPGVEVTHMHVLSDDGGHYNHLKTFFNRKEFDLSRGLDFNRTSNQGPIRTCVTHLDHHEFQYQISVNLRSHLRSSKATVRIFMAPRFDENGQRYTMNQQRRLFFMLDLFTTDLRNGPNVITRNSLESTLTIEIPQSLHEITVQKSTQRAYCGCGWPHHLLIPKGTENGMIFDLFAMVTNGNEDYVAPRRSPGGQDTCKPAPIYCGRLNDTYPDGKPMGYPFDRIPYSIRSGDEWWQKGRPVHTLEEYVNYIPNTAVTQVTITHIGKQAFDGVVTHTGTSQVPTNPTPAPTSDEQSNGNVDFREVIPNPVAEFHVDEFSFPRERQNINPLSNGRQVQFSYSANHDYRWLQK